MKELGMPTLRLWYARYLINNDARCSAFIIVLFIFSYKLMVLNCFMRRVAIVNDL
jgi:hypothetical protein